MQVAFRSLLCLALCLSYVIPASAQQSLMAGATAERYTIPQGWKLAYAQGFEGGLNASIEHIDAIASPSSAIVHSGSRALIGTIRGDDQGVRWVLFPSAIGDAKEIYYSWWDYLSPETRQNDEMWIWQAHVRDPAFQEVFWAYWNTPNGEFNSNSSNLVGVSQGSPAQGARENADYMGIVPIHNTGWTQFEVHYRANSPGQSDGFLRIYRNGALLAKLENKNLNGQFSMQGMQTQVGGTYTKLLWKDSTGACTQGIGWGTGYDRCPDFNNCGCAPNVPIHQRALDDIIVMVPSSTNLSAPPPTPAPAAVPAAVGELRVE